MVAPLFYIWESRRASRNTGKHYWISTCLRIRITSSWAMHVQKMAEFKFDFTRLSICLSTILEFHNKWLFFYFWNIIASAFWTYLRNFARPYSCWDQDVTHTHTHPPPTLRLIMKSTKLSANPRYFRYNTLCKVSWSSMPLYWTHHVNCGRFHWSACMKCFVYSLLNFMGLINLYVACDSLHW